MDEQNPFIQFLITKRYEDLKGKIDSAIDKVPKNELEDYLKDVEGNIKSSLSEYGETVDLYRRMIEMFKKYEDIPVEEISDLDIRFYKPHFGSDSYGIYYFDGRYRTPDGQVHRQDRTIVEGEIHQYVHNNETGEDIIKYASSTSKRRPMEMKNRIMVCENRIDLSTLEFPYAERTISYSDEIFPKASGKEDSFYKRIALDYGVENFMRDIFQLNSGDFFYYGFTTMASKGIIKFEGENKRMLTEIFHAIETGEDIIPNPEINLHTAIRNYHSRSTRRDAEVQPERTWGQEFLYSLNPVRVEPCAIWGDGNSYRLFYIGDRIIAEADGEGRATYAFRNDSFDRLHHQHKSELLGNRPDGFLGRIVHSKSHDIWKDKVRGLLNQ